MDDQRYALGRLPLREVFPSCNPTSQNAMIESTALKRINIIRFTRSTFEFYARNRILKYIEKRPLAMFRSKIIYSPKECVQRDRNDKDNSKNRPPESSSITGNRDP
jgi:hypothetical protein